MSSTSRFESLIDQLVQKDSRFAPDAYFFLREALNYTVEQHTPKSGNNRHVDGAELLQGFRQFALKEFGPMASTILNEWGIKRCRDIGDMVFLLISIGVFSKQENDSLDDFAEIFTFNEAFVDPFLPAQGGKHPLLSI